MTTRHPHGRILTALVAVGILLTSCGGTNASTGNATAPEPLASPAPPSAPNIPSPADGTDVEAAEQTTPLPAIDYPDGVRPVGVRIPAIGVDAKMIDLGLNDDGSLEVPSDFDQAGWFEHSPRPGQLGSSVIAGHIDSKTGPAVFFRLKELDVGDEVEIIGDNGETVTFAVTRVEQYRKAEFPFEEVFGYVRAPALRLITCGGPFDRVAGSYLDNTVVFAEQIEV